MISIGMLPCILFLNKSYITIKNNGNALDKCPIRGQGRLTSGMYTMYFLYAFTFVYLGMLCTFPTVCYTQLNYITPNKSKDNDRIRNSNISVGGYTCIHRVGCSSFFIVLYLLSVTGLYRKGATLCT